MGTVTFSAIILSLAKGTLIGVLLICICFISYKITQYLISKL